MSTSTDVELDGQYRAVREAAGILDRPDRGKLAARGAEAVEFVQGQVTNDVEALAPGEGCYAALLDRKGHMQADLRVLRLAEADLWMDTEGFAAATLLKHLETYKIGREVELDDLGPGRALLSVLGPAAGELTGAGPLSPEHAHREVVVGGVRCRAVATDLGVDLIVPDAEAAAVRDSLLDSGVAPVSEAAAEILRVEAGRPRFGAEMSDATIPAEAGIDERAVSFTKGCYIGQETVARLHYKGKPNRHLRGLRLEAPASAGEVVRLGDRELGSIGTACVSPALGPIALAIVRREAEPGERVSIGDNGATATLVELPFR